VGRTGAAHGRGDSVPSNRSGGGSDALHELKNRLYEARFLRGLMRRFRRKAALFPAVYGGPSGDWRVRSLREFDQKIVAGFLRIS